MKYCILLVLLLGLAGCSMNNETSILKVDLDRAAALCITNGGLRLVTVGFTHFKANCNNGALFTEDKKRI